MTIEKKKKKNYIIVTIVMHFAVVENEMMIFCESLDHNTDFKRLSLIHSDIVIKP